MTKVELSIFEDGKQLYLDALSQYLDEEEISFVVSSDDLYPMIEVVIKRYDNAEQTLLYIDGSWVLEMNDSESYDKITTGSIFAELYFTHTKWCNC